MVKVLWGIRGKNYVVFVGRMRESERWIGRNFLEGVIWCLEGSNLEEKVLEVLEEGIIVMRWWLGGLMG